MSGLATLFGSYLAAHRIFGQADVLIDVIRIGGVIAVGTAMLSFVFWTVTHLREKVPSEEPSRGLLTALCVIPLPISTWKLKTDVLLAYTSDSAHLFATVIDTIPSAIATGLLTF